LLLFTIVVPLVASPNVRPPEPQERAFESASLVAVVRIIEARNVFAAGAVCGTAYKAEVQSTAKGFAPSGSVVQFGFFSDLEPQKTYRIYLSADTSEEAWVRYSWRRGKEADTRKFVQECRQVHPSKAFFIRAERV
jgi:hypothetical protein